MSPMPDVVLGAAKDTVSSLPKDPRPPGLRLLIYRSNIAGLDEARGIECDNAWLDLAAAPVRMHARKAPKDAQSGEDEPPAPVGRVEAVRARLEARGPSRLRYEVHPTEDAPAELVARHERLRADEQLAGCSAASSLTAVGGQPTRAGLYGTRRGPTTATPRARTTLPRIALTQARRARIGEEYDARPALDVDEEPPRTARPTRRVLVERLFGVLPAGRSQEMPATARPPRPTISAPMPLQRKRRRSEDADAAPPSKRRASNHATHAHTPGSQFAKSSVPVGRHVQRRNNDLPPPSSHALSGIPRGVGTRGWRRRMAEAWSATIHALAAAVTATKI